MRLRDQRIEKWLLRRGWERIDYPFPRGTDGYKYTVYCNKKDSPGVWHLEGAVQKEFEWLK